MSEDDMTEHNKYTPETNVEDSERSSPLDTAGDDSEVAILRQQLEAKESEAKNNYDRLVRQMAESENLKKRLSREKEEAIRFANEALVRDLLPVIDNLERAVSHAQGGGNGKPLVEGVEMVLKGLLDVLAKHGAMQVSASGESFDPNKHEAMAHVETHSQAPNTVVEEFHKGYVFKDRLLRPALVSVAKPPISKEKKNGGGEVENGPTDD
jgi:molecular chaperone GrpE